VTPNGSAGSVVTTSVNDDTLAPVPQLGFLSGGAIVQPGSPGAATTATVPFGDHKLDDGPVGPVLDPTLYPGTTRFYIANYGTTGDIQSFTAPGFAASGPLTIPGGAIIDRITGIAMGKNPYTGGTTHAMFIVHGVTLTVWDLGASTRADVNVNSAFRARHGEGAISQLLSVATHPAYGDILIELLDSKGHVIVVNIDPYDRSCRNEFDVSSDEHFSSTFPDGYNTLLPGVTHIAVTPGFTLISLFPQIGGSSTFTEYQVSHF
jgi:hypothetical protein